MISSHIVPYTLIRTNRRSLSIQISSDGVLIARAPIYMRIGSIEDFIIAKKDWIQKHQNKRVNKIEKPVMSQAEIVIAKKKLIDYLILRIATLCLGKNLPKITSIKVTKSEKRWGSCSMRNGLCFSYRLAEYIATPFLDAIIIHELAHLREKHHQRSFWDQVYSMMPEYESVIKNRGDI
ncbi:DUF45 domain-containing protein [Candidatus Gracilibacteria bacterium]|nr:DUF45 domain-containing protein [Candidatus Gracilibacteria bacterium]